MDVSLETIRSLYQALRAHPASYGGRETPAFRALVAQIRAAVDERRRTRGDEMVAVAQVHHVVPRHPVRATDRRRMAKMEIG